MKLFIVKIYIVVLKCKYESEERDKGVLKRFSNNNIRKELLLQESSKNAFI